MLSIDCGADELPCHDFGVSKLPTIRMFHGRNQSVDYQGARRSDAILQYLQRIQRPLVSELSDEASLQSFKAVDDVVFIAYASPDRTDVLNSFGELAERHRAEFSFGLVSDPALLQSESIRSPAVVCYRPGDETATTFSNFKDAEPEALSNWLHESSRLYLGELTHANQQRLLDRQWPMVYLFADSEAERADFRRSLWKFAKGHYDSLSSVTADPLEFPELLVKFGLDARQMPRGVVHQLTNDRIYPYPFGRGISSNELTKWGLDVWQGRIKPWMPAGVTTTYDDLGPTKVATRKISVAKFPGMPNAIKIAGHNHDEL